MLEKNPRHEIIIPSTLPCDRVIWSPKLVTQATDLWERLPASQLSGYSTLFFSPDDTQEHFTQLSV